MPVDPRTGRWSPPLYPKQSEALSYCKPGKRNRILLNGPRYSGKTQAACHAICDHAWNTKNGNICVLAISQSVGIDSGIWQKLTEVFIPGWIEGNFGFDWVKKPYIQNVTKKPCCTVRNKFGGETRISLESLNNEDEVDARFKGKEYSMVFINELSKFKQRKTFDSLIATLRGRDIPQQEYLFLADTNPDLDLGTESPWYKLWYELPANDEPDPLEIPLRDSLRLVEFTIDDNFFYTKEEKAILMAAFVHDPDLMAAYGYGKWVTASTDALFYNVFRHDLHVIGEVGTAVNKRPEIMVPQPNCSELGSGWDIGVVNSAAGIIEKAQREYAIRDTNGKKTGTGLEPIFKILDEEVVIGEDHSIDDFVESFLKKMLFWENLVGKPVMWKHWSDRSAFDMKDKSSNQFHHQTVYNASRGKILLDAAARGHGSVKQRVDLFRKLLFQGRIFINNDRCPNTIAMCKGIKKGKSSVAVIQKESKFKHIFDALTYYIASECYDELTQNVLNDFLNQRKSPGISVVPL